MRNVTHFRVEGTFTKTRATVSIRHFPRFDRLVISELTLGKLVPLLSLRCRHIIPLLYQIENFPLLTKSKWNMQRRKNPRLVNSENLAVLTICRGYTGCLLQMAGKSILLEFVRRFLLRVCKTIGTVYFAGLSHRLIPDSRLFGTKFKKQNLIEQIALIFFS